MYKKINAEVSDLHFPCFHKLMIFLEISHNSSGCRSVLNSISSGGRGFQLLWQKCQLSSICRWRPWDMPEKSSRTFGYYFKSSIMQQTTPLQAVLQIFWTQWKTWKKTLRSTQYKYVPMKYNSWIWNYSQWYNYENVLF